MNSTANVFLSPQNAHQALLGTTPTDVLQLQIPAHQDHITMVLNVFHINHVIKEESGMILSVNASVHKVHSQMVLNVLNVPLDNFMPMEVVTAQ